MNQLQIYNHSKFGDVEVIDIDGNPWFGATQSGIALGYSNPHKAIIDHCRKDGLTKREVIDSLGRKQEMNFISEGNLYRLISRSKLPSAEEYELWIFDEVLPMIRKTGSYQIQTMTPMEMIAEIAKRAAEKEKEDQRRDQEIKTLRSGITTIQQTIIDRDEDWRKWINKMFNTAVIHTSDRDFQSLRNESYKTLEERGRCDLNARQRNLKGRLENEGATKSKINTVSKMDVIETDARLKEIYTAIVKELSIRYVPLELVR